ncbi:CRAL-TRIO domain-containing protein [Sparassis latifolia]
MAAGADDRDTILQLFREQLTEQDLLRNGDTIGTDDNTLSRFLRARKYDLEQATTMWRNCQNWRNTVEGIGIDELYRQIDPFDYPERDEVFKCWPLWFHKTDKKGRPVNIHHFGGINMPELYRHISPQGFWKTIVVNADALTREVLPASTKAAGRNIDGTFVIVDLKGFGISQFWQMKNLAHDSFQMSQDYFPETMAQLAIVNAPTSFTTIWAFIKPWLAKETVAKVDILGSDYESVLLAQIDAENLPESLGGTCTCVEAGGCSKSNAGPWTDGRRERRERWLRGEGELVEGMELAPASQPEKAEDRGLSDAYGKESEVMDAEGDVERSIAEPAADTDLEAEESTPSSSSMPSTPDDGEETSGRLRDLTLDGAGEVRRKKSPEESIAEVYSELPETELKNAA